MVEATAGTLGFLWPNLTGGFGGVVRIGTLDDLKLANSDLPIDQSFPAYVAEARAFIILVDPARQQFVPGEDVTGDGTTRNPGFSLRERLTASRLRAPLIARRHSVPCRWMGDVRSTNDTWRTRGVRPSATRETARGGEGNLVRRCAEPIQYTGGSGPPRCQDVRRHIGRCGAEVNGGRSRHKTPNWSGSEQHRSLWVECQGRCIACGRTRSPGHQPLVRRRRARRTVRGHDPADRASPCARAQRGSDR